MVSLDDQLKQLVADGHTRREIASIVGISPDSILVMLRRLGLTAATRNTGSPYGLTEDSYPMRAKLGSLITDMVQAGLKRREIGQLTGLNRDESYRAERRPYTHNWTLSQIERTLKHHGLTLKDIV